MLKTISLSKYLQVSVVLLCIGSVGCGADDQLKSEDAMDQEILAADDQPISVEAEPIQDVSWTDPKNLVEGDFDSPMPVLDSVDGVTLTPEEEERAIDQAREEEKHTKPPSKPKTPPSKE